MIEFIKWYTLIGLVFNLGAWLSFYLFDEDDLEFTEKAAMAFWAWIAWPWLLFMIIIIAWDNWNTPDNLG